MTLRSIPRVERGSDSSLVVSGGEVGSKRIDFERPFKNPPEVIVSYSGSASSATYGQTLPGARNVDASGFELTFCNGSSGLKNPRITWLAVGE